MLDIEYLYPAICLGYSAYWIMQSFPLVSLACSTQSYEYVGGPKQKNYPATTLPINKIIIRDAATF